MTKRKRRIMSNALKCRLNSSIRSSRRNTIYKMISRKRENEGQVPCFVCGEHVLFKHVSLEHIIPISKGGTDDMDNLTISHARCNHKRGNDENYIP